MPTTLGINDEGIVVIRGSGQDGVPGGMSTIDGQTDVIAEITAGYPTRQPDEFTPLQRQIEDMISAIGMPPHHRGMAMAKCAELVFWIRAGAQRSRLDTP